MADLRNGEPKPDRTGSVRRPKTGVLPTVLTNQHVVTNQPIIETFPKEITGCIMPMIVGSAMYTTWRPCVCVCSRVGRTLHRKYQYFSFSLQMYTRIWLDGVQCTGTESSLAECRHMGWGVSDCNHNDDVSIACYDNTTTVAPPGECAYVSYSVQAPCMC